MQTNLNNDVASMILKGCDQNEVLVYCRQHIRHRPGLDCSELDWLASNVDEFFYRAAVNQHGVAADIEGEIDRLIESITKVFELIGRGCSRRQAIELAGPPLTDTKGEPA